MSDLTSLFVQVINLESSADRLAAVRAQLDRSGLRFERCPGFDGRGIPARDLPRYRPWRARLWFGRHLTGGEVGCFLSHREAAKRFLDSGALFGLVLEDDVMLPPDFSATLAALIDAIRQQRIPGWRLINLGHATKVGRDAVAIEDLTQDGRTLCHCLDFPLSTHALLWSREGARRFLRRARYVTGTVDNWLRSDLSVHGGGYCIAPPFIPADGASLITAEAGARELRMDGSPKRGWWKFRSLWRTRWRRACGGLRARLGWR